ncbi:thioredoxin family protein [Gilvimarinus sp. SDUM040013]|uniref:Thioredoxin family protein n=1 Tax=Gilvimarinus gilvus TaxID=3058038 RepID=A0ABU4S3Y9_9GAMM|nr:thioredoxin family protein [Gilvimarinus sp. SDUM040013]MDO3385848.1 thioredoxin family protein [Gilvimarinus sp. SDUM040013]MDX6851141.1 thioredoxin family protein [Gilvimarinus sp. SDUM040013]
MKLLARLLATIVITLAGTHAWALDTEPFSKERFDTLQSNGTPVLVDVYATWCPTCAKQRKVLEAYQAQNPESELVVLDVDFDDQKEWVKHFKAPRQSTLILFSGGKQVWFSVAETREEKIFEALNQATMATP